MHVYALLYSALQTLYAMFLVCYTVLFTQIFECTSQSYQRLCLFPSDQICSDICTQTQGDKIG